MESSSSTPTHEQIAQRAREIYEQSGKVPGHDVENWLAAETQLAAAQKSAEEPRPAARVAIRANGPHESNPSPKPYDRQEVPRTRSSSQTPK